MISGIVGGFIGAAIMVTIYFFGVFVIGALLGVLFREVLYSTFNITSDPAISLIFVLIGGVAALFLQKSMIIVSTSFAGAWSVVVGTTYFTTRSFDPTRIDIYSNFAGNLLYVVLLCWISLGIAGLIVQYKVFPKPEEEKEVSDS